MRDAAIVVAGFLVILAAGDGLLALVLSPAAPLRAAERAALAFFSGTAAVSLFLLAGSLATPGRAGVAWVLAPTAALALARRRPRAWLLALRAPRTWTFPEDRLARLALLLLALEVLGVLGSALASGFEVDGAMFALKASLAFREHGFPLSHLTDEHRLWARPEHPLLGPLSETWFWLLAGEERAVLAKPLFAAWYASLLALVWGALRDVVSSRASLFLAAAAGALPRLAELASNGFLDVALMGSWLGSVVFLRRWLKSGNRDELLLSVLLAGFAAWTKREGPVYAAFQGAAILASPLLGRKPREVASAWPAAFFAALFVLPWPLVLGTVGVRNEEFAPIGWTTTLAGIDRLALVRHVLWLELFWRPERWGILWWLFSASVLLGAWRADRSWWYLVASVVLPSAAFGFAYVYSTCEPVLAHIVFSYNRLVLHHAPAALLAVAIVWARSAGRAAAAPEPEA